MSPPYCKRKIITYSHQNHPTKIIFNNDLNTRIEYLYDAGGRKVQKKVFQYNPPPGIAMPVTNTTDYLDGFQYKDGELKFFAHAEGYVNNTVSNGNNVYNYVFNYTDHLGNIRVSYGVNSKNVLKILEENHYYPFGLKHTNYNSETQNYAKTTTGGVELKAVVTSAPIEFKYKYNGKELQDELGLNMYDYDARNYDPAIGRWINIDPLTETSRRWSPYNYTMNNPVYFIDPDGMEVTEHEWGTVYSGGDATSQFETIKSQIASSGDPGKKPSKTSSIVIENTSHSTKTLTTFTHSDFIDYYKKEKESLENTIDIIDNISIMGGGKGLIEIIKDVLKGDIKYSWTTIAIIDIIATNQDLKNRLEKLNDVKDAYDALHKQNPNNSYGVYMTYIRAHIPINGGIGVQIYKFVNIFTGKSVGQVN